MQVQTTRPPFYPPRESLAWYHGAWGLMRLFVYLAGTARFEVPREDARKLRELHKHAAVLCPNHPTPAEGPLMYLVGHRFNLHYIHCAAREIYDKFGPLGPHLFPGLGCFSIRRRIVDLPAYQMGRRVLTERRNLILFPEGEISGLSDRLLPVERGGVQIAFWGAEDLQAKAPGQPLYLVPMAIKYREMGDGATAVLASLSRLERAFGLPAAPERGGLWRLERVESAYLASLESELGLITADGSTRGNERWDRVRDALAQRAASALGVSPPGAHLTRPQAAREMLNAWDAAWEAHGPQGPDRQSPEWDRLKTVHRDVARLNRFMGFDESYVADWPSVERFGDVLRRIEDQVFGKHGFRKRVARLRVGEPIDLIPLLGAYRKDKRGTVAQVMADLESRLDALLQELVRELSTPWDGAYDTSGAKRSSEARVAETSLRASASADRSVR